MKKKPDTTQLDKPKDIEKFLDAGAADNADRTPEAPAAILPMKSTKQPPDPMPSARVHREQKVFRLPLDLINTLKREAFERSLATGSRVTETDMVEQALRAYFNT